MRPTVPPAARAATPPLLIVLCGHESRSRLAIRLQLRFDHCCLRQQLVDASHTASKRRINHATDALTGTTDARPIASPSNHGGQEHRGPQARTAG